MLCCRYAAGRELLLHLRPDEESTKLLGRNPRRPRSTERVEDEIALRGTAWMRQTEDIWAFGSLLFIRS